MNHLGSGQYGGIEMHLSVYKATMKLVSLQKLCHMDVISVGHITEAVNSVIRAPQQNQDVGLNTEEMSRALIRMFDSVGHVSVMAQEEICSLMFRLYDRSKTGCVSAASFQTALIALSADNLLEKYRALVSVSKNSSGSVSRSGLRYLLQNLSQVPAAVQEEVVFGSVEAALRECLNGVLTTTFHKEHLLSWLQSNPRLLLWLPTLYQLSFSQNISHPVSCHTCKTFPITGHRYRCIKCVNVHVCQSCFLTSRQTRKHKIHHPVQEFCKQPTWRESLSSLVTSACYALWPRRHTQIGADRRAVLMWLDSRESQNRGPNSTDISTQLADSTMYHSPTSNRNDSQHSSSCSSLSKALQTDEDLLTQQVNPEALLNKVQNLHKDKSLFEQELQAWRLTVQSEHGLLQDRCSKMEVTMETIRQHHLCLQGMLTQALNKMELQQQGNMSHSIDTENQHHPTSMAHSKNTETRQDSGNTSHRVDTQHIETRNTTQNFDICKNEKQHDEEGQPIPSPKIPWELNPSHDLKYMEEPADVNCLCNLIEENGSEVAGLQKEDCLLKEDKNIGMFGVERLLKETINKLKTVIETDRWRERWTSETHGERNRAELLQAADHVGGSIQHLVEAVTR